MAKTKQVNTTPLTMSPFIGGLNTELSGIVDSTEFTKEELNVMIRQDGTRSRRPGIDYEEQYKFCNEFLETDISNLAFNCIEWTDINSPDEAQTYEQIPYIVCQVGGKIIFFKNYGYPFSSSQQDFTLDLADYRLDATDDITYKTERCKFTTAYGCLIVTSKAIKPIMLRAAQKEETSYVPGGALPSCKVSCRIRNGKSKHGNGRGYFYGYSFSINGIVVKSVTGPGMDHWFPTSTQLAATFNSLSSTVRQGIVATPAFADAVAGRTGFVDRATGTEHKAGYNSEGPEDWITFTAPDGSGLSYRGMTILLHLDYWTKGHGGWHVDMQGTMTGGAAYSAETGLQLTIRDTSTGAKDLLSIDTEPAKLSYAHLYNLLNQGWTPDLIGHYYVNSTLTTFPGNNLAQQYLKDEKTAKFKPDKLINMTFGNTPAARGHIKLNFFEQDRNNTAVLATSMNNVVLGINKAYEAKGVATRVTLDDILDLDFPNARDPAKQVPVVKPRRDFVADTACYAGRIFYLSGDVLLYSQIISEDMTRASYCYSEADPTSEELSDVVETDGGTISLPEIGEGLKLQQIGSYLLVFGSRGSMFLTGTANNIFTATAYTAGTLPLAPTQAPYSFVETEYGLFYWGTTSVNFISVNEGGLAPQDISTSRILDWFGRLTDKQHEMCKGVYSSAKKRVYWFYPTDDATPRKLDGILVYDIQKNAFTTHQLASEEPDEETGAMFKITTPEIVSGLSIKVPFISYKEYPVNAKEDRVVPRYAWKELDGAVRYAARDDTWLNEPLLNEADELVAVIAGYIRDVETDTKYIAYKKPTTAQYQYVGDGDRLVIAPVDYEELTEVEAYVFHIDPDGKAYPFGTVIEQSATEVHWVNVVGVEHTDDLSEDTVEMLEMVGLTRDTTADTSVHIESDEDYEVIDDNNVKILADDPISTEEFTYESSILLCLDVANNKVTFGDFRNNGMRDWVAGNVTGPGWVYRSYLISHPLNASSLGTFSSNRVNDIVHAKNMPYLITHFKRTETGDVIGGGYVYPSKCQGSILWDWTTSGDAGKWDSPQELYRPNAHTIFNEGYIVTKTNVRGIGRAFQVKLESVEDNAFILEAITTNLMTDGRI